MRLTLLLIVLALLVGCSSRPVEVAPTPVVVPQASPVHNDVLFKAFGLVGTPYRYGGSSPETGFDCSGLIHYVYREAAGLQLPRTTSGLQAMQAKAPSRNALRPGDLVLFSTSGKRGVDHAGIYVGEGRFLHAPSTGGRVRLDELQASYWQRSYQGARRVID
ncbi:MAG: C40 family peptidase [Halopseudomonas yangmingensis]